MSNTVDHPSHYQHPSGVEAIDICEHLGFNLGNAYKYLARAGKKGDRAEDLRKAAWYLRRQADREDFVDHLPPDLPSLARINAARVLKVGYDGSAHRLMLNAIVSGSISAGMMLCIADECDEEAAS